MTETIGLAARIAGAALLVIAFFFVGVVGVVSLQSALFASAFGTYFAIAGAAMLLYGAIAAQTERLVRVMQAQAEYQAEIAKTPRSEEKPAATLQERGSP